jgi:hypothetical protein
VHLPINSRPSPSFRRAMRVTHVIPVTQRDCKSSFNLHFQPTVMPTLEILRPSCSNNASYDVYQGRKLVHVRGNHISLASASAQVVTCTLNEDQTALRRLKKKPLSSFLLCTVYREG